MIEIDDSKYTKMVTKDAANLVGGLIARDHPNNCVNLQIGVK